MASTREEDWERLGAETFDLVIIGGGVVGLATARDAALRGLRVALFEADDFASGTSSRSSKLVHGGFRYLEQGDLSLVFESVSERQILMRVAPHLVRPLGFLFPIYRKAPVRLLTLRLGLFVYEGLALFRSPKRHRTLSLDEVRELVPQLCTDDLTGTPLFWDCATDDARLTLENAIDARRAGAVLMPHARVSELLRDGNAITGVRATDELNEGRPIEVRAGAVVNATGPWNDSTRSMSGRPSHQLRLTKGVHIVVPASRVQIPHTIVVFHPRDERVLFIVPWGDQVYVGTTDTDYEGDPAEVCANRTDVDYLVEAVNTTLPEVELRAEEVTATWAGLRALIRAEGVPPSQVSREHVVTVDPDGLISIAGGKLTTHRRMGGEVVDHVVHQLERVGWTHPSLRTIDTSQLALPGAEGWLEGDDGHTLAARLHGAHNGAVPEATCRYLADRYGLLAESLLELGVGDPSLLAPLVPGRPEILAQVDWAVQEEFAATVADVLERRTQLFFRDVTQGLGAIDAVAGRMAGLLGWSDATRDDHIDAYRRRVARSRAWRDEPSA